MEDAITREEYYRRQAKRKTLIRQRGTEGMEFGVREIAHLVGMRRVNR